MKNALFPKVVKSFAVVSLAASMVACEVDVTVGGDDTSSSGSGNSVGTLTDARDNQTYKIVTIGSQTWMAENLNYDYNKGTANSFCYDDDENNCSKYGRLYTWAAAMDSAAVFSDGAKDCGLGEECNLGGSVRGVCPEGWHLPSKDEWETLISATGGYYDAGDSLRSTSGWFDGGNGVDPFGFSALPAGYSFYSDVTLKFNDFGGLSYFWSATEENLYYAYYMELYYNRSRASTSYSSKSGGNSVRCLKDN